MTQQQPIPICLFTYNINKQPINESLLSDKLMDELPIKLSDLYCFGLQEFCSILDGCFHSNANQILINFNSFLLCLLNDKYGVNFQTLAMDHIGSTGIILLSPYAFKFQNIKIGKSSVGYFNSSMKGGVGVRLTYSPRGKYDTQKVEISILSCHLNAYEGEYYYNLRKEKLNTIIRSLDFKDGYGLIKPYNHIFIMGDLNFRTAKEFKSDSVETTKLFAINDPSMLNGEDNIISLNEELDELTKGLREGEILVGFSESEIKFQPTYKYHLNTSIYNSKRSPSWCDRILYLNTYETSDIDDFKLNLTKTKLPKHEIFPIINKYSSIDSILLSDHKPVILDITIPFKPPKSIINELSGCLQILPLSLNNEAKFNNLGSLKSLSLEENVANGPTTIYLKPTKLDFLVQNINRPVVDWLLGHSLWLTTTQNGRLLVFIILLMLWSVWYVGGST
ncbi:unnamed protein product [Candida verbasci]|uniref:Inositol polyphosphate-related phosphatase domain-containing protein n=1 Tax=Candida verbasci TaxID=1227364 RepID=A0A9W4TYW2_9ASCO|nr:unnamed protein product [Candida verbasci]